MLKFISQLSETPLKQGIREWLTTRASDKDHVQDAGRRLIEYGLPVDKVKRFPPLQIVLLDEKFAFDTERDDTMKGWTLPYWQFAAIHPARSLVKNEERRFLFEGFFAVHPQIKVNEVMLEQRLGLLCCVEALRLYAAENSSRLPAQLGDLKLPLIDSVTGQPFAYRVEGKTASLRGRPPQGKEKFPWYNLRYDVTIRNSKRIGYR
jgi:hypothetical protein